MNQTPFFYKTLIATAAIKKKPLKDLAALCGIRYQTFLRQLHRDGNRDVSIETAYILREALAPHGALEELFPEAECLRASSGKQQTRRIN